MGNAALTFLSLDCLRVPHLQVRGRVWARPGRKAQQARDAVDRQRGAVYRRVPSVRHLCRDQLPEYVLCDEKRMGSVNAPLLEKDRDS